MGYSQNHKYKGTIFKKGKYKKNPPIIGGKVRNHRGNDDNRNRKIRVINASVTDFPLSFPVAKPGRTMAHIIHGDEHLFCQRMQTFSCCSSIIAT